jgi:hypothetical protein
MARSGSRCCWYARSHNQKSIAYQKQKRYQEAQRVERSLGMYMAPIAEFCADACPHGLRKENTASRLYSAERLQK